MSVKPQDYYSDDKYSPEDFEDSDECDIKSDEILDPFFNGPDLDENSYKHLYEGEGNDFSEDADTDEDSGESSISDLSLTSDSSSDESLHEQINVKRSVKKHPDEGLDNKSDEDFDDNRDKRPDKLCRDLGKKVKEYLLNPEILPIHKWDESRTVWLREPELDNLFDADEEQCVESDINVVRDSTTGEITGLVDLEIHGEDNEDDHSMSRAPLPPNLAVKGNVNQNPFVPVGFEKNFQNALDELKDIGEKPVKLEDNKPGKFLGEELLTTLPGGVEGIHFAEDGITPLQRNLNTKEKIKRMDFLHKLQFNSVPRAEKLLDLNLHLLDHWKDDDDDEQEKRTVKKKKEESNENLINSLSEPTEEEGTCISVINITDPTSNNEVTSTEWAEMIDASLPVPNFIESIWCGTVARTFPFELDNFQKQAILKLEEGHHVFVAAHTSAGKTVVAEYAIAMSRRNVTRAIYTSPIKALSNQKYNDLKNIFGDVGLFTGDLQINASASCLVMTTEILRFMLYCGSDIIRDLEIVIFDEVHYINNAERGYVWEEVLILLPSHVRIVMLSATVPNSQQFAEWVGRTKKRKVYVVSSLKRPVPLCHYLYTGTDGKSKNETFLVLDQEGKFLVNGYNKAVAAKKDKCEYQKSVEPEGGRQFRNFKAEQTMWMALVDHLKTTDELPAVVFTLSRKRCDQNAKHLMAVDLTTACEKSYIKQFFVNCLERLREPDRTLPQVIQLQKVLENGIAVHHSGILPLLKEIVEMLFHRGYVKILFATETFAMGVNMPARTVVFDDITKFDGIESRSLTPAEYIQMAGRAGRRGLDSTGTVMILCKEDVPEQTTLKGMMLGIPDKLSSHYRVTYAMILSLLRSSTVTVEGMLHRSFREFYQVCQEDTYRKQLELAEKEYADLCINPLASHLSPLVTFYDTASAYIDVLIGIMPILLNQSSIVKELVEGRVLILSAGPYINQLGIYLNGTGPTQTPYKVLVLHTAEQGTTPYTYDIDDNWYEMLGFSALYDYIGTDEGSLDHTILCIAAQNVRAVTETSIEIDANNIIKSWELRQNPRFKSTPASSNCVRAVQELSQISNAVRTGATSLKTVSLTQSLDNSTDEILPTLENMDTLKMALEDKKKCTDIANFKSEFAIVYERKHAEKKRDKYKRLLSFENLSLYPDYQSRLLVLRELKYVDDQDKVAVKGRVACCMPIHELLLTELVYRNFFKNMNPAEIAALLSCFVFQAKTKVIKTLPLKVEEGIWTIKDIYNELTHLESKYLVNQLQGPSETLNFGLVKVVYEWALGNPFADIIVLTDVQEGVIVRCIQQIHELIICFKDAAVAIGDPVLKGKMGEVSTAINRDIVFSASLYVT